MSALTCIATPISWLRLERFAMAGNDATIASHVATCPTCAACLDEIRRDVVALARLDIAFDKAASKTAKTKGERRPWWHFALPAFAFAAAVIIAIIVWPRDVQRENVVAVKGVGEVILGTVRERDGAIRDDAKTFLPGDRWKVVITCPPAKQAWVDVDVNGDRPLAATPIPCGNRVVVPGAFNLTGTAPNRICVRVAATMAPDANAPRACVTIRPE